MTHELCVLVQGSLVQDLGHLADNIVEAFCASGTAYQDNIRGTL